MSLDIRAEIEVDYLHEQLHTPILFNGLAFRSFKRVNLKSNWIFIIYRSRTSYPSNCF
jgi:hypothetical protein